MSPSTEAAPELNEKRAAGRAALADVRSNTVIGLGTGSTVQHFLEALGSALESGALTEVRGVATSVATQEACLRLGIPTLPLEDGVRLDLAVDGADEVSDRLDLIKGLGGALLREKMVVQAAERFVVIADSSKAVRRLGTLAPVPVELVPFGWDAHTSFFRSLGAEPVPRRQGDDLYVTDNGNHIVDLRFEGGIEDPEALDEALHDRAGVVETGLFLGMAERAYVGTPDGVVTQETKRP